MDGDVVRYRALSFMAGRVPMPIGEPHGRTTPRSERIVREFRAANVKVEAEPRMDAWLKTHAAFEVPLGRAVRAAGEPAALAEDGDAVGSMLRLMRQSMTAMPTPLVPGVFGVLQTLPEGMLVALLRRFLRSKTAAHSALNDTSPSATAELDRLAEQMRTLAVAP